MTQRWRQAAALNPEVLESLYEVNQAYLQLLGLRKVSEQDYKNLNDRALPFDNLDPATQRTIARCPFSLFNARFQDSHFWARQTKTVDTFAPEQQPLEFSGNHSEVTAFAEISLFFAWHLVRSNTLAARILLGMTGSALRAFGGLSLGRIQRLASQRPELVTLRWSSRTAFWLKLLQAARTGATDAIGDLRLLGIQMVASEVAFAGAS